MKNETKSDILLKENQILTDAYDKIVVKMHLQKQMEDRSVFLICGTDPKVGATSASIFLARALARSGRKVLLLDGDMRKEKKMYGTECEHTLAEYLTEEVSVDTVIYPTNYEGMDVLPGGKVASPVQLLCSSKMRGLLSVLRGRYEFVIIDIPSAGAAADSNAVLGYVDQVVLVAAPERSYKKQIMECYETFEKYGVSLLGVIVNRVDKYGYHDYVKNANYYVEHENGKATVWDIIVKRLLHLKDKLKVQKKTKDKKIEETRQSKKGEEKTKQKEEKQKKKEKMKEKR